MTTINLLPSEVKQRQRTKRSTALVAVAGGAVVAVLVALWFLQGVHLADTESKLSEQQQTNARLQGEISKLHRFEEIRNDLQSRRTLLRQTLAGTVEWSGVLHDLSLVVPDRVWLTQMIGQLNTTSSSVVAPPVPGSAPVPGTATGPGPGLVGSIQFQGDALDKKTVALWLTKLESVRGWVNAWLSQATEQDLNGTTVVSVNSSVDLTKRAAKNGGGA
jgi:Tfp pilus assembly protein PilN